MESTRLDKWLWSVRIFKTRTEATGACRAGHIRVNDTPARAASPVRVGDRITGRVHGNQMVLEVVQVIEKRVGAAIAAQCLVDRSPPAPAAEAVPFARDPASGRPTKRDRRQLDRLRRE